MKKIKIPGFPLVFAALAVVLNAAAADGELEIKGDYVAGSKNTGEVVATGHVFAVSSPYRFYGDAARRSPDGIYDFTNARLTTCTNHESRLHWALGGQFRYEAGKAVTVRDAVGYAWGSPCAWFPFWYYPINSDYGLRFMPGYTSRWGGYFLSGYVYNIFNENSPGDPAEKWSLGGSTYFDYRMKNGAALGQTVRWSAGFLGRGKFRVYHAWDRDYDRYAKHRSRASKRWSNWSSPVEYRRYGLLLQHKAAFTERDSLDIEMMYLSDSQFLHDFFEKTGRYQTVPANQIAYQHRENSFAGGVNVSGPVNEFYGGVARLPEFWLNVEPQPLFGFPVNYESQTHIGYLDRQYAKYKGALAREFRYSPGKWADYQSARIDSYHRVSVPFKLQEILSVVPRASYRATWYSDSGERANPAKATGDELYRGIYEFGFTASARGWKWITDSVRHTVEPYLDYSFQDVAFNRKNSGSRMFYYDNIDNSLEWLDQYGFEGRGLPVRWHGLRPGLRNSFQVREERLCRTVFDSDIYAAIPFRRSLTGPDGRPSNPKEHVYSTERHKQFVPGLALRWNPDKDKSLRTRFEYDFQNDTLAYADIAWHHDVSDTFSYYARYSGRDFRIWDYGDRLAPFDNKQRVNLIYLGFTHNPWDMFGYSPFVNYDARRGELDEIGTAFELRTDCLAFRLAVSFVDTCRRIDGSKRGADFRCGFFVYLRAMGYKSMDDFSMF